MKKEFLVGVIVLALVFVSNLTQAQSDLKEFSQGKIGQALKEALDHGIKNQVSKLTLTDGFYKNERVKILLPKELQKVDKRLRRLGLSKLVDEGLLLLNRAAEDAVSTATPIFVKAVKKISFKDAKNILLGDKDSATKFLRKGTSDSLYNEFNPVIKKSFAKVGADKIWTEIISKYNGLPFVKKVNPDLTDYVTNRALDGVFIMIAIEEEGIRRKIGLRDTKLLQQVFALQDIIEEK